MKRIIAVVLLFLACGIAHAQSLSVSRATVIMMRTVTPKTSSRIITLINSLNGRPATFVFDGADWTINTDVTFPATVYVVIDPGTKLNISAGKTVTFTGGLQDGSYVKFSGTGNIAGLPFARAEWFEFDGETKAQTAVAGEVIYNGGINLGGITRTTWPSGGGAASFTEPWRMVHSDAALDPVEFPLGTEGQFLVGKGTNSTPEFEHPNSIGAGAVAAEGAVAFGAGATAGAPGAIAIGDSSEASGSNTAAIGYGVVNTNTSSVAVRGNLYLDGGTGILYRTSFGSGAWEIFDQGKAILVSNYLAGFSYQPGDLVRYSLWPDIVGWNGTYCALVESGTNIPFIGSTNWAAVALDGADGVDGVNGAPGAAGAAGADGIGNILYDNTWQYNKNYEYSSETNLWVRHKGRLYECIATSSNLDPTAVGGTNYWAIAVDKGASGDAIEYTNWFYRGAFDTGDEYTTNDVVTYGGNLFLRTNITQIGGAPTLDGNSVGSDNTYWNCLVQKGARGATGVAGADGAFTTNILNFILVTNDVPIVVTNVPFSNAVFRANYWEGTPGDSVLHAYWTDEISGSGSGFPLTNNGDLAGFSLTNGFFAGDGSGLTNLTGVATGMPIYVELDPSFASVSNLWYGILTNVQSTAVTGAVTSVNGIDGDVVIAGATNSGQTIYVPSGGDVYLASNNVFTATNTLPVIRTGTSKVILGDSASASGDDSIAIGRGSRAVTSYSVCIGGYNARADGSEEVSIGAGAGSGTAANNYGVNVGSLAGNLQSGAYNVNAGSSAGQNQSGTYNVNIGSGAGISSYITNVSAVGQYALGYTAGKSMVGIGRYAGNRATGDYITVIGDGTQYYKHNQYYIDGIVIPRVMGNETFHAGGNLHLYDPYIDNLGGGAYTNNLPSGDTIFFHQATNQASIKCDFNTGYLVCDINDNMWSNNAAASGGGGMTNGYTIVDGGNVGTNVTFSFGAGQVQKYTQTAPITNTIYSVPDTNKLWELTALIYGNGLDWDWNTNSVTFLGGDEPDLTSNGWNTVYLLYNPLTTKHTTVGVLE